jgi:hypothetical protein
MKTTRPIAAAMVFAGVALIVAGPLIPGEARLTRIAPPEMGHVTDLGRAQDGAILAGTQDGDLWRLDGGGWSRLPVSTGGQPITALPLDWAGDPTLAPIGTGAGLLNPPPGVPALETRISDEVDADGRLVVATDDGVRVQGDGAWVAALDGVHVYRLEHHRQDGTEWLHAGTVGAGVFSATESAPTDWQANGQGLPEGVRVFTFAVTRDGRLIAGTDVGAFWQGAPGQAWRPLPLGLPTTRLLALHLDAPGGGPQTLWIGGDQGLWRAELSETADDLSAPGGALPVPIPREHLNFGVSWILPMNRGVVLSAGSVYQYGPTAASGWFWISLTGVALVLAGGGLFPARRRPGAPAQPA